MQKRSGIVLMMTLGFIAVITALVMWSVSISQSRFNKVVEIDEENQFMVVFGDFTKMITKFDINSSESLELFLSMQIPPIVEAKTKIGLGFRAQSMMDKLNINYILHSLVEHETNTTNRYQDIYLRRPLEKFFAFFSLSDPFLMIDFLLDTVDKDLVERGGFSEIAAEDFDFRVGKIYNFEHFKKITQVYYKQTKDTHIFNITKEKFEKYFYFGEPKDPPLLDCSSPFVLPAMELITEDELVITQETDFCQEANRTLKTLNKIYNISQFENKKKYLVKCTLNLDTENGLREISFVYDVKEKRISNIDKNFQEQ